MLRQPDVAISPSFARVCGIAGIGFATTIVLANIPLQVIGFPRNGATGPEILAFVTDAEAIIGLSSAATPFAWLLSTLFGAGVVAALWKAERDRGEAWSWFGFAGIILQNATFAGVIATRLGTGLAADRDSGGALGVWSLGEAVFTLNGTFLGIALAGLSIAGLRAGLISRWHGWLGLLAAALQFGWAVLVTPILGHPGPFALLGLAGWLLWVVWLVVYGITLLRLAARGRDDA